MTHKTRVERTFLVRRGWKSKQIAGNEWVWEKDKKICSREEAIKHERKNDE